VSNIDQLLASIARLEGRPQNERGAITPTEARQALIKIGGAALRGDIDQALREERLLYLRALRAVAAGAKDAKQIATIAVNAADLEYDRG